VIIQRWDRKAIYCKLICEKMEEAQNGSKHHQQIKNTALRISSKSSLNVPGQSPNVNLPIAVSAQSHKLCILYSEFHIVQQVFPHSQPTMYSEFTLHGIE
jgi:hypothetical protein